MFVEKKHTCTGHRAALYALAPGFAPGQWLSAGGEGWIVAWQFDDPETGKLVASVPERVFSLCTLPAQRRIVAGNMNGGLHWIDLDRPDAPRNLQHHRKGVYEIISAEEAVFSAGGEGVLTRWEPEQGRSVESLQLSAQALRSIAWSPAHRLLAVGASDGAIYLVDSRDMALVRTLSGAHLPSVFTVAWSPDGRYLLSGGRDAMLRVWDSARDFALHLEQPAHWFTLNHLVFSPDGRWFASASRDKTIKIWETATFQLLKVIDTLRYGSHVNSVNRLLWLPEGLISASDDRTMNWFSISDGSPGRVGWFPWKGRMSDAP